MPDDKDKKSIEDKINRLLQERTLHQGAIIKGQVPDFKFSAPVPDKPIIRRESTDDKDKSEK